jgi:hypothetical protein
VTSPPEDDDMGCTCHIGWQLWLPEVSIKLQKIPEKLVNNRVVQTAYE